MPSFQSVWPGAHRLTGNTALMLVLLGAALALLQNDPRTGQHSRWRGWAGRAGALLAAAIGLVTLMEYLFGWNVGIDEWLWKDSLAAARDAIPGRPSFPAALCAVYLGLGLALLDVPFRRFWPSQVLAVLSVLIALLALTWHLSDTTWFYGEVRSHRGTAMSIPAVTGFLILGVGLLCARAERGLMVLLRSHTPGGILARRLMLAPVVGLLLTGLVYLVLSQGFKVDRMVGTWAFGLSILIFLTFPIWAAAHTLHEVGLERDEAHRALEERVKHRTAELTQANTALETEIAERRQAEDALRKSQQLLQAIIDNSSACVYVKDLEGHYLLVNRRWTQLVHLSNEAVQGKRAFDIFPAEQADAFRAFDQKVLAAGHALEAEELVSLDDGLHTYLSVKCPLYDESGRPYAVCGISTDITERKLAEVAVLEDRDRLERQAAERTAKLRETIGDLEAFSYSVAHDMRAPLRSMRGFAELLLDEFADQLNSEAHSYLERIAGSASRMDNLILDALNYTHVLRADAPLTPVELDPLVRNLVATYPEWQLPEAEIRIDGNLPPVLGNEAFLTQCVSNLVGNAIKFVTPGVAPRVRIWAESTETNVRIFVEDNGIGIASKDHERIFGMFERLNHVTQYPGTGIGLAIVHKAVERMGGGVDLVSEPGKGSKFWIELKKPPQP
jgi:PAS domain S-box-containing protein